MNRSTWTKVGVAAGFLGVLLAGPVPAAEPPELINYQGVLRGSNDAPLDGNHDMVFRFWSAEVGGNEILVDSHTAAGGSAVAVTGGLFNVVLGGGSVTDGTGPGVYASLGEVFRDHGTVWLEIEVGGETLSPRMRALSSPYAQNSLYLGGKKADAFVDTGATTQAKTGKLIVGQSSGSGGFYGIEAYGTEGGGYFDDTDGSGQASVGSGDRGIEALGNQMGGYFKDLDGTGYTYAGYGSYGLQAYGSFTGGYFKDLDSSGYAYVGIGDRGIEAYGNLMGGLFNDGDASGRAYVAYGHDGLHAFGDNAGGYFEDLNSSGYAHVAYGDSGIQARGNNFGGYFVDLDSSGIAYAGWGDYGLAGFGTYTGGYFDDANSTGLALVGYGDRGIWAKGTFAGGTFSHPDNVTYWADVAQIQSTTTYKIRGTGTVSFVQNHPHDPTTLVTYAAPEGDEVAVYARGRARLEGGRVVAPLSETFALVANPDVGLTAHVTPRTGWCPLYVEAITTESLTVGSADSACADASFDYLVYGLRLGFEQHAPLQPKDRDAFLPPHEQAETFYASRPELRRLNAMNRFADAQEKLGEAPVDLSRTQALVAAVNAGREEALAAAREEALAEAAMREEPVEVAPPTPSQPPATVDVAAASPTQPAATVETSAAVADLDEPSLDRGTWLPVAEPVEAGDVLSLDAASPGTLRRAATLADRGVIGIASKASRIAEHGSLEVLVGTTGIVTAFADAGYGEIRPGDLLVASPTPGHAMRALEPLPGTILGKAIDPLEAGTGAIRVLLGMR